MATTLNMTMRLKQDRATKDKLVAFANDFAATLQHEIDRALRASQIVHFARVVLIEDQYLQVLTEFDGDKRQYTEFFRRELSDVFKTMFELVEGAPDPGELDPDDFYEFSSRQNIQPLGVGDDGYVFSAYGTKTVKEILNELDANRVPAALESVPEEART
jgi:hypothetical protein